MKISQQVESILRFSQAARDSDRELLIIYMQKFGLDLSARQIELFRQMPSVETIRRTRQSLQEKGLYPASKAVDHDRYNKYIDTKYNIKHEEPAKLLENNDIKKTINNFGW